MVIIAFGDIHMRTDQAERIPGIGEADCVVVTGDLTMGGGRVEASSILHHLTHLCPRVYAQIGNMDTKEVDALFTDMGINLNGKGVMLGDMGIFGLGGSKITRFGAPSEFSEAQLEQTLWRGYESVKDARFKVLFSHMPPVNTLVDEARRGDHAGSTSVRRFLEDTDCHVCICGHIHEAIGTDTVGSALVINPGTLYRGGYVRIECDGNTIKAHLERC